MESDPNAWRLIHIHLQELPADTSQETTVREATVPLCITLFINVSDTFLGILYGLSLHCAEWCNFAHLSMYFSKQ